MITIAPSHSTVAADLQAAINAAYARARSARNDPFHRPNYRQQKEREHLAEANRLRRELTLLESSFAARNTAAPAQNHHCEVQHIHSVNVYAAPSPTAHAA